MKLFKLISEYRWPIYLGGLLTMSVVSSGVIAWVATRPDTPRPMKDYYETARAWDANEAVEEASRQMGWSVRYELPSDVPHFAGMPRPVDVRVAVPQAPGTYRTLVRFDAPGAWELRIDVRQAALRFVHAARVVVPADQATEGGANR